MTLLHQAAQKAVLTPAPEQIAAARAASGLPPFKLSDDLLKQIVASALQQKPEPVACDHCGEQRAWVGLCDRMGDLCGEAAARENASSQEVPREPVAMIEAADALSLADDLEAIRRKHWMHWTAQENHIAATSVRHLRLLAASPSTTQQQEVGSAAAYVGPPDWLRLAQECGGTVYRHRSDPQSPGVAFGDESWARFVAALSAVVLAASPSTPERAEKDTSAPSGTEGGEHGL